ncbi:MAG: flagellar assembly protein FliH [Planctomycetes bacterium]|jgi:flagellar biosynthesis/type III secretory pathway protein FliH|nr:flagellar assembly protein FliH [Planctomycetota bacterium]
MLQMPTVSLKRPIFRVGVISAAPGRTESDETPPATPCAPPAEDKTRQLEAQTQQAETAQLMGMLQGLAENLQTQYDQTLTHNRTEIARLAVEIARKILRTRTDKGDYEIQAVIEEALKRSPTRQDIVVRLNPEDLPRCQQLQQEAPQGAFGEIEFTADWSIGRGECLVETSKGVIRSFIDEHLDRIAEALEKVE